MPEPVQTVIAAAREFLGDRITTNATLREHHSHGQDRRRACFRSVTRSTCRWSPGAPAPRWRAT